MKKVFTILTVALLAVSFLASCAAGSKSDGATEASQNSAAYNALSKEMDFAASPSSAPAPMPEDAYRYDMENGETSYTGVTGTYASPPRLSMISVNMSEKIIYTINADIETVDFDNTINKVYAMMDGFGAFDEGSYVGGRNHWQASGGYQTYRTAWFTIRVPAAALSAMTDHLSDLGSVTNTQKSSENVTSQYIDTESRLKSYRTQEERLFSMMEKAETVEDMLTIEKYLADVRYQIEALTSQLTNWQNRIEYSTLTLNISEVEKYSEPPPELPRTYWQQVSSGFNSTLVGVGGFFTDLLKWVIVNSPVLAILAVIIAAIIVVTVRRRAAKRKAAFTGAPPENKDE